MIPRVSVVIPAYQEGSGIEEVMGRLPEAIQLPCEIIVVVDTPDDSTVPYVEKYAKQDERVRIGGQRHSARAGPGDPLRDHPSSAPLSSW